MVAAKKPDQIETDLPHNMGIECLSNPHPAVHALARAMHIPIPERVILIGIEAAWSGEFGATLSLDLEDQLEWIYVDVLAAIDRHNYSMNSMLSTP